MCRKLVIELKWDDEHAPDDAGEIFNPAEGFNTLQPEFENSLTALLEDKFFGAIEFKVLPL